MNPLLDELENCRRLIFKLRQENRELQAERDDLLAKLSDAADMIDARDEWIGKLSRPPVVQQVNPEAASPCQLA